MAALKTCGTEWSLGKVGLTRSHKGTNTSDHSTTLMEESRGASGHLAHIPCIFRESLVSFRIIFKLQGEFSSLYTVVSKRTIVNLH